MNIPVTFRNIYVSGKQRFIFSFWGYFDAIDFNPIFENFPLQAEHKQEIICYFSKYEQDFHPWLSELVFFQD